MLGVSGRQKTFADTADAGSVPLCAACRADLIGIQPICDGTHCQTVSHDPSVDHRPNLVREAICGVAVSGGEVFCYPGPMMHAKTAIIDDNFAMIGSYNLDERSRAKNLEVNVAVEDVAFATYVRTWFDRDVKSAKRVDLYEWRARPLARRGIEYVAYALRKLW